MKVKVNVVACSSFTLNIKNMEELNKIINEMTKEQLMEGYWIDDVYVEEEEEEED